MKVYGKIGEFKRMNIKVILNDNEVLYEGKVEDASLNIKELHFSKVMLGKITEIYVYDKETPETLGENDEKLKRKIYRIIIK